MGRLALSVVAMLAAAPAARADDGDVTLADRWREVPAGSRLRLSQQITDELAALGNFIGTHVNVLSDDIVGLRFDGRRRHARVRLGTGEGQYLRFKLDSDWQFAHGRARIRARLDLGLGDHHLRLDLPEMEMLPASVYGQRGVEVRLPLFERRW